MQKVTFNKKTLDYITVMGGSRHVGGASRDVLEFHFAETTDFETLHDIFINPPPEIRQKYPIEGEKKPGEQLHLNYTVPVELALRPVDGENHWLLALGQLTPAEKMQAELSHKVAALEVQFAAFSKV